MDGRKKFRASRASSVLRSQTTSPHIDCKGDGSSSHKPTQSAKFDVSVTQSAIPTSTTSKNDSEHALSDRLVHHAIDESVRNPRLDDENEISVVRETQSNEDMPLQELKIAVLGHSKTGKSTFIKSALDLKKEPLALVSSKKVSLEGHVSLVRLIEVDANQLRFEDDSISWPNDIDETTAACIDGVLLLFDVTNAWTFDYIESTIAGLLAATSQHLKCLILVATKCDTPPKSWQITSARVSEFLSKHKEIESFQTALRSPETHKRCVSVMFRNIMLQRQAVLQGITPARVPRRPRAATGIISEQSARISTGAKTVSKHSRAISDISSIGLTKSTRAQYSIPDNPPKDDAVDSHTDWDARIDTAPISTKFSPLNAFKHVLQRPGEESTTVESTTTDFSGSDDRIAAVTFTSLLSRLLKHPTSKPDARFLTVFFCFYPKFAHPSKLLKEIVLRYEEVETYGWPDLIKNATRQRYLEVLYLWMAEYACDFFQPQTRNHLMKFLNSLSLNPTFATAFSEISSLVAGIYEDESIVSFLDHRRSRASTMESYRSRSSTQSTTSTVTADSSTEDSSGPSKPIISTLSRTSCTPLVEPTLESLSNQSSASSTSCKESSEEARHHNMALKPHTQHALDKSRWRQLMNTSEGHVAIELTRIDWLLYSAIRPRDLIKHISLGPGSKDFSHSPGHVIAIVEQFNHIAMWVANLILLRDKPKHRALMLEKFLAIAWKLRYLNNYNSLGAVIAGINGTAIYRLSQTRALVSAEARKQFMRLEILMGTTKSHAAYRLGWQNTSGPRIPFLPLHLRDLVSAEAGNKTMIQTNEGEKINWRKFEVMGEVVLGIQESQNLPYPPMKSNSEVNNLIMGCKFTKDEDELFDRSVQLEAQDTADISRRKFGIFQR